MASIEKVLIKSEESIRALFDSISTPTYVWQKIGDFFHLIDYNKTAYEFLQGAIENYIDIKASEMYKERVDILEDIQNCFKKKNNFTREMKYYYIAFKEDRDLKVKYVYLPPDLVVVHTEDITEQRKAEQKLKDSEEKFSKAFRSSPTMMAITRLDDGYIVDVNDKFTQTLGYNREELIEHSMLDLNLWVNPEERSEAIKRLKEFGKLELFNVEVYTKSGEILTSLFSGDVIDLNHEPHLITMASDITERIKTEKKLKESEEKFRRITEESHLAICILQDNVVKYANQRIADLYEYTIEELLNWNPGEFIKLFAKDSLDFVLEQARKKQAGDPDVISHYLIHCIKKSGDLFWVDNISKTITYNGKPADLITLIDITERKKVEEKLKESEEKYRSLFNNMNAGFAYHEVIVDDENKPIDYKFIEANPAFEKLTGLKAEDIIGKNVTEILPGTENDPADWIGKFGNVGLTGIPVTIEDYSEAIDRWFKVSGYSPKKGYFAVTFTDITERQNSEQNLKNSEQKYREAFDQAMFYKDLFTHDMNNILSVLNSSAELITHHLGASTRSKEIENITKIMKTQVERGSKLISNVRTLSELDKEESPTYPTKVCDLLLNAKNFVAKAFEERNIQIKIDSFKKNLVVTANDLLLDVFENILINSIKYNENTYVDIFIRISKEQFESKNYIKLEFLDNGIGVPDDRKEIIFKPGNREFKGTKGMGLGLSLVSKILFIFKGKIWVEDKVNGNYEEGSNFVILLPVSN